MWEQRQHCDYDADDVKCKNVCFVYIMRNRILALAQTPQLIFCLYKILKSPKKIQPESETFSAHANSLEKNCTHTHIEIENENEVVCYECTPFSFLFEHILDLPLN